MFELDPAVKKETLFLAGAEAVMTAIMFAVFLALGRFDLSVLAGGMIGFAVSLLNFFLMCLTVQRSVRYDDDKKRKTMMNASMGLRLLLAFALLGVSIGLLGANPIAALLPLLFPRITIIIRQIMLKKEAKGGGENGDKTE
ncbi:MAG: ATP synthase subunit I [Clostridia bacterium]|nr:ATP synthase subunit I [Clostridia bacterium]